MRSKQYFTSIKNNPHEISTDPLKRINVTNGSRLTRSFVLFLEKYECLKDIMR